MLHIGNVIFGDPTPSGECSFLGYEPLMQAAELLGVEPQKLAGAFRTHSQVTRGERISRILDEEQCEDARDATAKALYARMFSGIFTRVNSSWTPAPRSAGVKVGVLDIFGFENFATNSFEQLCINVANEQLQKYFNQHIFEQELHELEADGVRGSR